MYYKVILNYNANSLMIGARTTEQIKPIAKKCDELFIW